MNTLTKHLAFHKQFAVLGLITLITMSGCSIFHSDKGTSGPGRDQVDFTLLQINDFYEIAPLDRGTIGGAARIATLRKKLMAENPNTYFVLAGDFLSPSLLGTLKWEGERLRGKHMVDVLNKTGLDLACFGNHEFDLDEASLQKRINESQFDWVASNILQLKNGQVQPFAKAQNDKVNPIPTHRIVRFQNQSGAGVQVGIISPCLPANKVAFVRYEDVFESVKRELAALSGKVDFIIGLTHLNIADDLELARRFPEIDLILGGHDHDHMKYQIGKTVITKADANAKTAYVHRIRFDLKKRKSKIRSELVPLHSSIALDGEVNSLVQKWKNIEYKLMRELGFDPDEVLVNLGEPYDARESTIRNQPNAFGQMICKSISKSFPDSDCAILNSGSVRVDDMLQGQLSQYDILRSLPFGGGVIQTKMKGGLLLKTLESGWANRGSGGFLQWDRITRDAAGRWFVGTEMLDPNAIYTVGSNDFLLTGMEKDMDYLNPKNPEVLQIYDPGKQDPQDIRRDIRLVIVNYLKKGGR
ncbi:MAG TPA: bifunctional metallophosphatase/5'-nucleotidase [Saprospiraceae bacterium]|nr:bifunctional metallophosphatase/5'-nucleotidase [Saprospiraceae bacterium]